jgi:hypothetical protein
VTAAGKLAALLRARVQGSVTVAAFGPAADREAAGLLGVRGAFGLADVAVALVAAALVAALRVTLGGLAMPATENKSLSRPPMRSADVNLRILTTANRQHDALLFNTVATLILAVSSAMPLPRCTQNLTLSAAAAPENCESLMMTMMRPDE